MSFDTVIASERKDFKVVSVVFDNSQKVYNYKTFMDIKEEDEVIVDTPSNGYVVVEVVKVTPASEYSFEYPLKWIVSKLNTDEYLSNIEYEKQLSKVKRI